MEDIHMYLARNIKKIRQKEKLSLEKVAQLSGVSKTMVGQIERGESSPTLSTIWKIANGLKVSFSSLIECPKEEVEILRRDDRSCLKENEGAYRIYPLFPFDVTRRFEVYQVEMDGQTTLQAEAHREGTEEFITVYEGELLLVVGEEEYRLKTGDSIRFKADSVHRYSNESTVMNKLSMTIYYE